MVSKRFLPQYFLILCLAISLLLVTGCKKVKEQTRLPPRVLEPKGALTMDENTHATIRLRGGTIQMLIDEIYQSVSINGLENVGVGTHVLLEGGGERVRPEAIASYQWTWAKPTNSATELDDPSSRTPVFIPDVTGHYTINLTIANAEGVEGRPASLTIHAGTWVGNGLIRSASDGPAQCIDCHADKFESWRETRHAVALERALDGQASPYYSEQCIQCHTVGLNPLADNGGFDDVARELGWTYPEELRAGNYAQFTALYPRLANLGNVQCEACHGPGNDHQGDADDIATSLRPELCIACHDPAQHDQYAQWARSGHADTSLPQIFPTGIDDPVCSGCHTTQGFIAAADGQEIALGGEELLACQACHDPHSAAGDNQYQVRYYGSVQLPDGTRMMNMGSSALCIHCHNVGQTPKVVEYAEFLPPQAAAAEMLAGVGGYTFGQTLDNSPHVEAIRWYGGCVKCHMVSASTEGETDFLSATMNEPVGDHTFLVRWDNGTPDDPSDDYENLRACDDCHGEIPRINGPADTDYDGDGERENVQDEVQGLLDLVREELIASGVKWTDEAPYWGSGETLDLRAAIYNWSYVNNDGSHGLHNTARAVELLQLTYHQLTGKDVPNAVLRVLQPPKRSFQDRFTTGRPFFSTLNGYQIILLLFIVGLSSIFVFVVYRTFKK